MLGWWRRLSKGVKIAIIVVVVVGVPAVAGQIANAGKHPRSDTAATSSPTAPAAAPASRPATSPAARPSTSALPAPGPASLAPAATRRRAAGILHANDAYYKTEFDRGVTVILARGQAGSYPAFSAWYQKASADIQPGAAALKQADALFTADNEPPSVGTWRDDNSTVQGDIATLAQDGLGAGGPDDATARQKVHADLVQFATDYATAERDADHVAAGK